MIPRRKWNTDRRNVRVNDVVVVVENPNAVTGNWKIGKVIKVYPGKDSKVRNERVKTGCEEYEAQSWLSTRRKDTATYSDSWDFEVG